MQGKLLQPSDKVLFIKHLNDYASRAVKMRIRASWSEKTGMTESAFRDKMNSHRSFKGQEMDIVESLFLTELGKDVFDNQMTVFISQMSDGDLRTNDKAQTAAINKLVEQNDEMVTSKILNL